MIAILLKLDAKLDRPVEAADIDKLFAQGKGPSASGVKKRFGGLANARRAAGILRHYPIASRKSTKYTDRPQTFWKKYTPDELVAQIKGLGQTARQKAHRPRYQRRQ